MMTRFKHYIYANLYLLLPVVLLIILLPVLIPRMTDWVEPEVRRSYSACDYGRGGSINFCENEIWWRGIVYGAAASTFLAWVVSQLVIWVLHIRWRSPLYGVVFFGGGIVWCALLFCYCSQSL